MGSKSLQKHVGSYAKVKLRNSASRWLECITMHGSPNVKSFIKPMYISLRTLSQCFSTAGPRPGAGPWHQLYRAARGLRKIQYATRFH